jgi:AraC family transcriptional regulator
VDDAQLPDQYLGRFKKVLVYIERHLHAELSVEVLSAVASSSAFHFHRQFTGLVGVAVSKYVHLRRLHTAVWQLAHRPDVSVLEVARQAGYESPEAFARAFKRTLGVSPSEFRRTPAWAEWNRIYATTRLKRRDLMNTETTLPPISIVQFPETRLAVLEHRGSHDELPRSIQKFIAYRRQNQLAPAKHATFNLVYDNPQTTEPHAFRMDICCAVTRPIEPNPEGVVEKTIPAGRCARIRCQGGDDALETCLSHLYGAWLPTSAESVRDFPLFFQRIAFFPDVPEHEAITDIFLPLLDPASALAL